MPAKGVCSRWALSGRATCKSAMHSVWLLLGLLCISPVQAESRAGLLSDGLLKASELHGEGFPKQLVDPLGGTVLFQQPPQRIVSVTLASDEMLADLGAIPAVVGVTHLVDNPDLSNVAGRYPAAVTRVGGDIESILALQPDLVIVASYTRIETVRLLLGAGLPVLRLKAPETLADLKANLWLLAELTGHQDRARIIIDSLQMPKSTKVDPPRVLYYDLSGSSVGPGDLTHELISLAGGYNVMLDTGLKGFQPLNTEQAISLQPEIILLSGWATQTEAVNRLLAEPAWKHVPAVEQRRVCALTGAWRSSASHFRWQGLAKIAACLKAQESLP